MKLPRIVLLAALCVANSAQGADLYRNYAALAAKEREGADYQILTRDAGASRTVLAIHGGWIERGTGELAQAIARTPGWNLYLFEADHLRLHLTSKHFDEPRAVALVGRSNRVLSIHGFYQGEDRVSIVCVGGGNKGLSQALAHSLRAQENDLAIRVEYPCTRFDGSDPSNIVNRGRLPGVQLELSRPLRERIRADEHFAGRLAQAVQVVFQAP